TRLRRVQPEGDGAIRLDLRRDNGRRSCLGFRLLGRRRAGGGEEDDERDRRDSVHERGSSGCGRLWAAIVIEPAGKIQKTVAARTDSRHNDALPARNRTPAFETAAMHRPLSIRLLLWLTL